MPGVERDRAPRQFGVHVRRDDRRGRIASASSSARAAPRPRGRPPRWAGRPPAAARAAPRRARAPRGRARRAPPCARRGRRRASRRRVGAEGRARALAIGSPSSSARTATAAPARGPADARDPPRPGDLPRTRPAARRRRPRRSRCSACAGSGSACSRWRNSTARGQLALDAREQARRAAASVDVGIAPAHFGEVQSRDGLELGALDGRRRPRTAAAASTRADGVVLGERLQRVLQRRRQRADPVALGLGGVEPAGSRSRIGGAGSSARTPVEPGAHDRPERQVRVGGCVGAAVLQAQLAMRGRAPPSVTERRDAQQRFAVALGQADGAGAPAVGRKARGRDRAGSAQRAQRPARAAGSRRRSAPPSSLRQRRTRRVVERRASRRRRAG